MADKPISFKPEMIRAILEDRKTQTRRIIDPQPSGDVIRYGWAVSKGATWDDTYGNLGSLKYWAGDRLWVREAWRAELTWNTLRPHDIPTEAALWFEADGAQRNNGLGAKFKGKIRHGMFMPRWASRLTLIVEDVRVQRLQDISEKDAIAEGILTGVWSDVIPALDDPADATAYAPNRPIYSAPGDDSEHYVCMTAREAFERLWNMVHGNGSIYSGAWADNPWVAAYNFRVIRANIDSGEVPHG